MPPGDQQKPTVIIIRRKKKGGNHAGHHGGAWKVAYADFVTAMMSFFLLLWLLNVTTDVERKGIADYFAPSAASESKSGSGGIGGGQTVSPEGAEMSDGSPPTTQNQTLPTVGKGDEGDEDTRDMSQSTGQGTPTQGVDPLNPNNKTSTAINANMTPNVTTNVTSTTNIVGLSKEEATMVQAMKSEEKGFDRAEDLLKQAILSNPELRQFANQIIIDRTPEGLRIQIIDQDKFSMFPSGGAIPYERARDLLLMVGKVLAKLPNNISVTGHTDGNPFSSSSSRDNWTLSTERANISRELVVSAGVDEQRVQRVSGLADRDPFVPQNPKDARNRRISIVLLRQAIPPANQPKAGTVGEDPDHFQRPSGTTPPNAGLPANKDPGPSPENPSPFAPTR